MDPQPKCEYGYKLHEEIEMTKKDMESYIIADTQRHDNSESFIISLRDNKFPKEERRLMQMEAKINEAVKDSAEAKNGFKTLIISVIIGLLGLMVTNIFNQFWTSSKMDQLYDALSNVASAQKPATKIIKTSKR